ncbi:MAG: gluconate 2-dehydrogenase subunit 3 family protein [Bacteroidota bacterium]
MNSISKLTRREFIKLAGIIAAGLSFVSGCLTPRRADKKVLSDDEESLLNAIVEQIIPTDEWSGGRDAGVVNFIRKQLEGPYRRFQGDYRKGLAAITRNCLEKYNEKFEALPWEQQTSFLTDMESGRLNDGPWKNGFGVKFFELLRSHSLQGYYGSPRHGGNKNFVSYKMIGLDEFQVIGQNRYGS